MPVLRRRTLHAKSSKSRTCGKKRYYSMLEAKLALADLERKDSTRRGKQERRAYYCKFCKGYHLTSQPFDAKRREQDRRKYENDELQKQEAEKKSQDSSDFVPVRSVPTTDSGYMTQKELEEYANWAQGTVDTSADTSED